MMVAEKSAREKFLADVWQRYPAVSGRVISLKEIYEGWRKFAFGNERLSQETLHVGLRLISVSEEFGIGVSEDLSVEVRWQNAHLTDAPGSEDWKLHEILKAGDVIVVHARWSSAIPQPESHRIEMIHADGLTLMCPSHSKSYSAPRFGIEDSRRWALFMKLLRDAFKVLGFTEVRTPTLVPSPGIEPHLDPFQTQFELGQRRHPFYLPTSPEYHLKKMLAHGWQKIFEFKESFRNGELTETHQPEFLMLEWYRAFATLAEIEKDLQGIFNSFVLHWPFERWGLVKPRSVQIERISMSALFEKKTGFALQVGTTLNELWNLARDLRVEVDGEDTWDDVFFRIFVTRVESDLGMQQPLLVYDYPPSQAALARINERGWADRFELYYKGFEIANAYHELNDPVVQRERFQRDLEVRDALGKTRLPIDEELLQAMEYGMPPSSGIAVGVERLFLAFIEGQSLDQARVFPIQL